MFFSVIIPTYNREAFIKKAIDSVLMQTFRDFEIIVVDDGSTDKTETVVKSIVSDKLFYYKKENAERGAARNYGIKKAIGKYVTFLDSDDFVYTNHLQTAYELIITTSSPEFFSLAYEIKNEKNQLIRVCNSFDVNIKKTLFQKGNILSCNAVFIRSDVAQKNLFNENRILSGSEDYELWIRLVCQFQLYYSNIITSVIINHQQRSVIATDEEKLTSRILFLQKAVSETLSKLEKEKKYLAPFHANTSIYLALHLIINHNSKRKAITYIYKAVIKYPLIIFTRSFLAVIKRLLF